MGIPAIFPQKVCWGSQAAQSTDRLEVKKKRVSNGGRGENGCRLPLCFTYVSLSSLEEICRRRSAPAAYIPNFAINLCQSADLARLEGI